MYSQISLKFQAPAELLHDILLFTSREEIKEICKFICRYWKNTLMNIKSELPYQNLTELSIRDDPLEIWATSEGQFSKNINNQNSKQIFANSVVEKMVLNVKNSISLEKVLEILRIGGRRIRVKTCIVYELWNRAEFLPLYITLFNEIIDPSMIQYNCQNFRPILWVLKSTGPTLVDTLPSSATLNMEIPINNADQGALIEFLKDEKIYAKKRKIVLIEGKRIEMNFCAAFTEVFLTTLDPSKFFKNIVWTKTHPTKFEHEPRWNRVPTKNGLEKYVVNRKDANIKMEIFVEKFLNNPHKIVVQFCLKKL